MSDEALGWLAGGVLAVGIPDERMDAPTRARLVGLEAAGVVLFARNVRTQAQVRTLTDDVRATLHEPVVLVDQEGGRVDRLRGYRGRSPAARDLARQGRAAVADEARRTAVELRKLGIDVNLAPVVDLDEGNEANGIGDRSFGTDPHEVAELAGEVVAAHDAEGVATCLKHFPGLGRTGLDTHLARPAVAADSSSLVERELVPFRALAPRCGAVMVSHAAVPSVSGTDDPASLSPAVVSGFLRRGLGFDGLVISDDLAMGAVSDRSPEAQAVEAIAAGCDLLLFCAAELGPAEQARKALVEAAREPAFLSRLRDAHARVLAFSRRRRAAARQA